MGSWDLKRRPRQQRHWRKGKKPHQDGTPQTVSDHEVTSYSLSTIIPPSPSRQLTVDALNNGPQDHHRALHPVG
jgi:hypothetical protein